MMRDASLAMNHRRIIGIGAVALAMGAWILRAEGDRAESRLPSDRGHPSFGFPVGEELGYRIYWGKIPVGISRIRTEWVEEGGRKKLAIRYRNRTNKVFNAIYPVHDEAESIIRPGDFLPERFAMIIRRRGGTTEAAIDFDYAKKMADVAVRSGGTNAQFALGPGMRDIISFMYQLRSQGLSPRQTTKHQFMSDTGPIDLTLKTGEYEDVVLPLFGKVSSLKVEPEADFRGFLVENGKVTAWIAKERCLCTRMVIKAPVANVNILLCQVLGPGNDFWTETRERKKGSAECKAEEEVERSIFADSGPGGEGTNAASAARGEETK